MAIRQRENSFRRKYDRYIRTEPDNVDLRRKAYTAVAAKLARVAHALIKEGIDYRGYHEIAILGGGTSFTGLRTLGIPQIMVTPARQESYAV